MTHTPDWWTKEDAALFEAAPEMLEICKSGHNRFTSASHTLRMIAASFGENSGFSNWLHYKANQMDAVIAKTEGEQ